MQQKQKWLSAAAATRWDGTTAVTNEECLGMIFILSVIVGIVVALTHIWP